ncbi:MAG TPA: penicillin-binding protein 2 [Pilimelia sp.]|nr:penicillin-binding protein 2 [Pilimelia sp.]
MNAPLRRVGVVVLVLFGLLFANLNWVQAVRGEHYRTSPYNGRVQVEEYERQRGVVEADGKGLAVSKATSGELKYLRSYPFGPAYAHVVGYKPVNLGATGVERYENEFLAGTADRFVIDRLRDQFRREKTGGGHVLLTISRRAQETAYRELSENRVGAKKGAVVALDPATGAVQAMVSLPSFNPNPLASHDTEEAAAAYRRLEQNPAGPLRNRAVGEIFPPGSTFKVVVAAAALENGHTPDTAIPAGPTYTPPQTTRAMGNAHPSICPESRVTLKEALTESCNTGFARLGVKLGPETLKAKARDFGFGDEELTCGELGGGGVPVAASKTGGMLRPDGQPDPPVVAQSSIGQNDVAMTPMQGALIAAAVANDGVQMHPYVVKSLLDPGRRPVETAAPRQLRRSVSADVARQLREMMVSVVQRGTGTNAQIEGAEVGGKTGTAEGGDNDKDQGWFIGFVLKDGKPISAVAVLLEQAGAGGSAEATRIAGRVMRAVLRDRVGG